MNQLCQRIQQNLQCLPPKDVHKDKKRNFNGKKKLKRHILAGR